MSPRGSEGGLRRGGVLICTALLVVLACSAAWAATACRRGGSSNGNAAKTASSRSLDALDAPDESLVIATPAAATAATALPQVAPAGQCDTPMPHASGDENGTLKSGGLDRTYILHVPKGYDGTRRMPLVINLHGFGSNARQQAIYSGLPAKGDTEGFITVTPNGTGTPQRWALGGGDDIAFMRELLDDLESRLCIDAHQVFAAGISNGAGFAQQLACAMPDRIAAVAPVAAMVYPLRCASARPIPVIGFHGTDDPCVPYAGGTSKCGLMLPIPAVEDSARNWAKHDGCNTTPAEANVTAHVRAISYSECKDGTAVVLIVVDGGGHTWPGSIDVARLGVTTHEINATDEIWQFFAAHPLP